jgi:hypothetical protein
MIRIAVDTMNWQRYEDVRHNQAWTYMYIYTRDPERWELISCSVSPDNNEYTVCPYRKPSTRQMLT